MNNPNSDWLNGWLFSAGGSIRRPQILQRVPHGSRLQVNQLNYLIFCNEQRGICRIVVCRWEDTCALFVDGNRKFKSSLRNFSPPFF